MDFHQAFEGPGGSCSPGSHKETHLDREPVLFGRGWPGPCGIAFPFFFSSLSLSNPLTRAGWYGCAGWTLQKRALSELKPCCKFLASALLRVFLWTNPNSQFTIRRANYVNKKFLFSSPHRGAVETNPTRNHEVAGSIPGLAQWVKDLALL